MPRWRKGSGLGWVTAEYGMLPRATNTRMRREAKNGQSGRTQEIQRLIGRALRAVVDTKALGENTIVIDCDVLQADGGTRTAAITGAYVALADAIEWGREKKFVAQRSNVLFDSVSAVSVWRCLRVGVVISVSAPPSPWCRRRTASHRRRQKPPKVRQTRSNAGKILAASPLIPCLIAKVSASRAEPSRGPGSDRPRPSPDATREYNTVWMAVCHHSTTL